MTIVPKKPDPAKNSLPTEICEVDETPQADEGFIRWAIVAAVIMVALVVFLIT